MLVVLEAVGALEIDLRESYVSRGKVGILLLCALESAHCGFFVAFGEPECAEFVPLGGGECFFGNRKVVGEELPSEIDGDGVVVSESHAGSLFGFVEDTDPCIDADSGAGGEVKEGATAVSTGDFGGVLDLVDGAVGEADQAGYGACGGGDIFGAHRVDTAAFGGKAHRNDVIAEGVLFCGGQGGVGVRAVAFEFEECDIDMLALKSMGATCFEVVFLGGVAKGVLVMAVEEPRFDGLAVCAAIPVDAKAFKEAAVVSVEDDVVVGDDVSIGSDDKTASSGAIDQLAFFVSEANADADDAWDLGLDDLLSCDGLVGAWCAVGGERLKEFEGGKEGIGLFGEVFKVLGGGVDLEIDQGLFVAQEKITSAQEVLVCALLSFKGGRVGGLLGEGGTSEGGDLFDLIFASKETLGAELCEFLECAVREIVVFVREVFEGEGNSFL